MLHVKSKVYIEVYVFNCCQHEVCTLPGVGLKIQYFQQKKKEKEKEKKKETDKNKENEMPSNVD